MNILTIDTSTDIELISVTMGEKTFEFAENVRMSHSVTMFDSLGRVLKDAGISLKDIDLVAAGVGPGSFTGVRIAVSTARMIAQVLRLPLAGLISQDIYAASASTAPGEKILVAFDAKKSRVFASLYANESGFPPVTLVDAGDYSIASVLDKVSPGDRLLCIGDGCVRYAGTIEENSGRIGFSYRLIDNFIPRGDAAARLARMKYSESPQKFSFYGNTVPFYARKSDAEIAKEDRERRG